MAILYFIVITFAFTAGNRLLFGLLIGGEAFHLFQILGFCFTVWDKSLRANFDRTFLKPVDVFITVCGEPIEIVRKTAIAALKMNYPNFNVYLLNDGYVAKKDNWREVEDLARELSIRCFTRRKAGGAKAGNINYAVRHTSSPYFAVFDADHVPYPEFLIETMGYFTDDKMGFVQTPQYYKNQSLNRVTETSWQQQTLFFGPIMSGKNRTNSAFMCGTNMVVSRDAITSAGGMCEFNIAEDFLTSLFIHEKGWSSVYVPKVLATGLAPEDFLSYNKQQFRWTRGSLEVIFKYNPLLRRGLTWGQKLQYLISASYYLSGVIVLIDALLPIVFLLTGATAIHTPTMYLAGVFIPYIFLNLYTLQKASNLTYSFEAISFSISSFFLQIKAIGAVITNQKTSFSVTSKQQIEGNYIYMVLPQIGYIVVAALSLVYSVVYRGISSALFANLAWILVNIAIFIPFIRASFPKKWPKLHFKRQRLGLLSELTSTETVGIK
ncbi:MAG: hypothetical protein NVSMB46_06200 [Candidatus Saccharimonadales bacterium]